jgi:hypothetical protein
MSALEDPASHKPRGTVVVHEGVTYELVPIHHGIPDRVVVAARVDQNPAPLVIFRLLPPPEPIPSFHESVAGLGYSEETRKMLVAGQDREEARWWANRPAMQQWKAERDAFLGLTPPGPN